MFILLNVQCSQLSRLVIKFIKFAGSLRSKSERQCLGRERESIRFFVQFFILQKFIEKGTVPMRIIVEEI